MYLYETMQIWRQIYRKRSTTQPHTSEIFARHSDVKRLSCIRRTGNLHFMPKIQHAKEKYSPFFYFSTSLFVLATLALAHRYSTNPRLCESSEYISRHFRRKKGRKEKGGMKFRNETNPRCLLNIFKNERDSRDVEN